MRESQTAEECLLALPPLHDGGMQNIFKKFLFCSFSKLMEAGSTLTSQCTVPQGPVRPLDSAIPLMVWLTLRKRLIVETLHERKRGNASQLGGASLWLRARKEYLALPHPPVVRRRPRLSLSGGWKTRSFAYPFWIFYLLQQTKSLAYI